MPREILAFDIETVPDPEIGRAVAGYEGSDAEVVKQMMETRLEETDGRTAYPVHPFHRIVTIGVAGYQPETGEVRLHVLGDEKRTEPSLLRAFEEQLPHQPQLCSWNGRGFDLPVIRYRALRHGIALPTLHRPRGYLDRYRDDHIDVMDHLSNFGASYRVGLGAVCDALRLPSKSFLTREIHEHVFAGELDIIEEYCLLDCVSTLLVHIHVQHLHGGISHKILTKARHHVADHLRTRSDSRWSAIADGLEAL